MIQDVDRVRAGAGVDVHSLDGGEADRGCTSPHEAAAVERVDLGGGRIVVVQVDRVGAAVAVQCNRAKDPVERDDGDEARNAGDVKRFVPAASVDRDRRGSGRRENEIAFAFVVQRVPDDGLEAAVIEIRIQGNVQIVVADDVDIKPANTARG